MTRTKEIEKLFDGLPNIPQYEDAVYSPTYICPSCMQSGFKGVYDASTVKSAPYLVGRADTNIGTQLIFECPFCFEKYRFHPTRSRLQSEIAFRAIQMFCEKCLNWKDFVKEK